MPRLAQPAFTVTMVLAGTTAMASTMVAADGFKSEVEPGRAERASPNVAAAPAAVLGPRQGAIMDVTASGFGGDRAGIAVQKLLRPTKSRSTSQWVDPMPAGTVTSCFGQRWGRQHAGVDIAAAAGTTVSSAGAGEVVSSGANFDGYGISVLIRHAQGFSTHYAHLSSSVVEPGAKVQAGDPIGAEGSTGNSTGPHLHFEVRKGGWDQTLEPTAWMRQRGVDLGCAS